nr:Uma2 family endonuclease [Anaerolineae bacterium]
MVLEKPRVTMTIAELEALEKPRVTMTIAELEALAARPENSAKSFEMLEGELYEMDTPAPMHSYIATRILVTLYLFVEAHHPGVAMGDNTGYALSGDTLLVPDISFVAQSRLPAFPWPARFSFAPDVAVEVLSPANKPRDLLKKVQTYLK